MRPSHLFIAISAAAAAMPAAAQDFGGIARGAFDAARSLARSKPAKPPAPADQAAAAQSAPAASSEGGIVVAEDMPVLSSDGVRVAVVKHTTTGGTSYAPDKTFFTADRYYRLRRIYGREASVSGGAVHLKMTAAQYLARNQNPDN